MRRQYIENFMKIGEKIEKIVLNVGVGKMRGRESFDSKILPEIESELSMIAGQKARHRGAKKSIAGFKMREGDIVGLQITLRKNMMEDFAKRLVNAVLPRVKDFRGIDKKNIDEHGNFNLGLKDQRVFPEIDSSKSKINFGLQITFVQRGRKRNEMIDFYGSFGIPFKK